MKKSFISVAVVAVVVILSAATISYAKTYEFEGKSHNGATVVALNGEVFLIDTFKIKGVGGGFLEFLETCAKRRNPEFVQEKQLDKRHIPPQNGEEILVLKNQNGFIHKEKKEEETEVINYIYASKEMKVFKLCLRHNLYLTFILPPCSAAVIGEDGNLSLVATNFSSTLITVKDGVLSIDDAETQFSAYDRVMSAIYNDNKEVIGVVFGSIY